MPNSAKPIRILIVDDHPAVREGISDIIKTQRDMLVAAEATTGEEAIREFRRLHPDLTLMDLNLPVICSAEAIGIIRREIPGARIIAITGYDDDEIIRRAFRAGVEGFLLKDALRTELLPAIRAVHAGRNTFLLRLLNGSIGIKPAPD